MEGFVRWRCFKEPPPDELSGLASIDENWRSYLKENSSLLAGLWKKEVNALCAHFTMAFTQRTVNAFEMTKPDGSERDSRLPPWSSRVRRRLSSVVGHGISEWRIKKFEISGGFSPRERIRQ